MTDWTPELKEQIVAAYQEQNPNSETTIEICKLLAEDFGVTVNGLRRVLVERGVYISKSPKTGKSADGTTSTRVSKADAICELNNTIKEAKFDLDESMTKSMTGKSAVYFTEIIKSLLSR